MTAPQVWQLTISRLLTLFQYFLTRQISQAKIRLGDRVPLLPERGDSEQRWHDTGGNQLSQNGDQRHGFGHVVLCTIYVMYQYGGAMRLPTCTHVCSVLYQIKQSCTDHCVLLTCCPYLHCLETNRALAVILNFDLIKNACLLRFLLTHSFLTAKQLFPDFLHFSILF